jgi:hypothetical protein
LDSRLKLFRFDEIKPEPLAFLFDAFSSREPVSASLETQQQKNGGVSPAVSVV